MASTKQPKIVGYMASLYDKMTTTATELPAEDGGKLLVWQGRLIETCNSVGIPTGYYKRVVDTLRTLGCVEMLVKGTRGSTLTTVALRQPPTQEAYDDAIVKAGWKGLTDAVSPDTLAAEVREMQSRLGGIDWLSIMGNFDERLERLETAVEGLSQQVQDSIKTDNGNNAK